MPHKQNHHFNYMFLQIHLQIDLKGDVAVPLKNSPFASGKTAHELPIDSNCQHAMVCMSKSEPGRRTEARGILPCPPKQSWP